MEKRYKVVVYTFGHNDYEDVASFSTKEEAEEKVKRLREHRDEKVDEGFEHWEDLEWKIVELTGEK